MSEECLDRIETELGLLRTDVNRLQTGQDDLRREMRVLHEDVIATIKANEGTHYRYPYPFIIHFVK